MIIDRTGLSGPGSYFQDPASPGRINLGGQTVVVRTPPLNKGQQLNISGLQLLMEGVDLGPLFAFQFDPQNPQTPAPLFGIKVNKEMFSGLFADPYAHRVHKLAGHLDFNEGTLINGTVLEVDGIPTITSTGRGDCIWTSREYELPEVASFSAIAWELATSRLTPPDSFHYRLNITSKNAAGVPLPPIDIDNAGQMLKADARRAIDGLNHSHVKTFQVTFTAKVFEDSYLRERHLPLLGEQVGRPLLRAVNLLQPVQSAIQFHSLSELKTLCSEFEILAAPGPAVTRVLATIDLAATIVSSPFEDVGAGRFEYVELALGANSLSKFELKRIGHHLIRS